MHSKPTKKKQNTNTSEKLHRPAERRIQLASIAAWLKDAPIMFTSCQTVNTIRLWRRSFTQGIQTTDLVPQKKNIKHLPH